MDRYKPDLTSRTKWRTASTPHARVLYRVCLMGSSDCSTAPGDGPPWAYRRASRLPDRAVLDGAAGV